MPTFLAGVSAHRGSLPSPDFWSVHPLTIVEAVAPHLFGNYYDAFLADIPWMTCSTAAAIHFSIRCMWARLCCCSRHGDRIRPRRSTFWLIVACLFIVASFGGYTPIYPFARRILTPLAYFRFPVKSLTISVFACAVLVAEGWEIVQQPPSDLRHLSSDRLMRVARAAGLVALGLTMVVLVAAFVHHWSWNRAYSLAVWLKHHSTRHGSRFPLASRAAAVRPCGGLAVRWRGAAGRRLVEWSPRASCRLSAVHGGLRRSRHHERGPEPDERGREADAPRLVPAPQLG